jgi:hypothetical protein
MKRSRNVRRYFASHLISLVNLILNTTSRLFHCFCCFYYHFYLSFHEAVATASQSSDCSATADIGAGIPMV